jgi:hypothetical protein
MLVYKRANKIGNTPSFFFSIIRKKFDEAAERRKEKKLFYASLTKEAKEREAELAKKYRDRAKERREQDKNHTGEDTEFVSTTANFKAVAPGFNLMDNAMNRRQIIEESKYLGGDLEHTHLVKGLDYALLQKVKAETEKSGSIGFDIEGEKVAVKKSMDDEKSSGEEDNEEDEDDERVPASSRKLEEQELQQIDEQVEDEKKSNQKLKILSKSSAAAYATALNKSLQDSSHLLFKR